MTKSLKKSWWTLNVRKVNSVNEKELNKLYRKFLSLDKGGQRRLSNAEFLSIEELKWTPFWERLIDAMPLKTDPEV